MKLLRPLAITFSLAFSVSAADLKIGTVDVAKAFSEYYKTKDADGKLQENARSIKEGMQELLARYKSLNDDAEALSAETQDAGLEAKVRAQKRVAMQAKVNEMRLLDKKIQEFRQGRTDQLHQQTADQRKGLYDDIQKVISEKANAGGYDLVVDRSGVSSSPLPYPLHAKESVTTTDITPEVIAELNKNAPAGATPARSQQERGKEGPEKKSAGKEAVGGQNVDARGAQAHPETNSPPRHPDAKDTYTITATLELAKPFNLEHMNDDFQEARLISLTADSCVVEITYYPLFRQEVGENRNWQKDYAGMTEYLQPTPSENWDEKMRADLLAELRAAGIDPEHLTDKQLVEQVSRWAIRRTHTTDAFSIWALHYPEGKPTVFPPLRAAFERIRGKTGLTEQQMIDQEALGRSMYYGKVRGSCTSSSVYLTTIFRALGIPTRIVFCDPPFDPNDPKQAEMFYNAIRHHQVRETVRAAMDGLSGSCNHLFNEVYVGGSWVRLNYSTLGQPILDSHYFGLLTHVFTTSDFSRAPVAETWGMRYFRYGEAQPRLSSVNPYRLISVSDHFGENARVPNPEVAAAALQTVTIVGLIRPGDTRVPDAFAKTWQPKSGMNFLISAREWVPGTYRQMRAFEQRASHDFLLTASGHPEVHARLTGLTLSKGDGAFQAYEAEVVPDDRAKVASGIGYTIKPINSSETYRWQVAEDLGEIAFQD